MAMTADDSKDQTSVPAVRSMRIESPEQIQTILEGEVQQLDELSIRIAGVVEKDKISDTLKGILEKIDKSTLKKLDLGENNLEGYLRKLGLGNFTELIELDLHGNSDGIQLNGCFDKLSKLENLNLQGCWLLNLPAAIWSLTNLEYLNLSDNLLTKEILSNMVKLTGLQKVILKNSKKIKQEELAEVFSEDLFSKVEF